MVNQIDECKCSSFIEIKTFQSIDQFHELEKELEQMMLKKEVTEIDVEHPFLPPIEDVISERWFRCTCGSLWRLVYPDYPFRGFFRKL